MPIDLKKLEQTPIEGKTSTEKRPDDSVQWTDEHEHMVNEMTAAGYASNFLESVNEWGLEKGWITERQDEKLRELYENFEDRGY